MLRFVPVLLAAVVGFVVASEVVIGLSVARRGPLSRLKRRRHVVPSLPGRHPSHAGWYRSVGPGNVSRWPAAPVS